MYSIVMILYLRRERMEKEGEGWYKERRKRKKGKEEKREDEKREEKRYYGFLYAVVIVNI